MDCDMCDCVMCEISLSSGHRSKGDWSEIKVGKDFSLILGSARINGRVADAQKIKISHTLWSQFIVGILISWYDLTFEMHYLFCLHTTGIFGHSSDIKGPWEPSSQKYNDVLKIWQSLGKWGEGVQLKSQIVKKNPELWQTIDVKALWD